MRRVDLHPQKLACSLGYENPSNRIVRSRAKVKRLQPNNDIVNDIRFDGSNLGEVNH